MTQIAFLGTGLLGAAFVEAARKRGDDVTVWNRTIEKARALEKFGARVGTTPPDAVRGVNRVHLDLAAVYKLLGNAFVVGMNALAADVFAIGAGAGVSSTDALKILDFFNPSGVITARGKKMIDQDFEPSWELTMARKDVRLMV